MNTAKVMIEDENVAITPDYLAIEVAIDGLNASQATIKKPKQYSQAWALMVSLAVPT